jgi:Tol biopolymer transport system component
VASADHTLAARALLQLGRCYEQLGNTEARTAYERLIARYPDQSDLVAQAKTRLTALVRSQQTPASATTALPGIDGSTGLLAISPDGTKAIVWDFTKGQNLAVYDFASKQTRVLTDLDWIAGHTDLPVWSPDSRRVAYAQARLNAAPTEIRVMTLDGQPSVVYRTPGLGTWPMGWTPDGATLVIVDVRPDKTWAIGTMPARGGSFTPLRSLGWSDDWRGGSPRLSPDGRFVAYLEGEAGLRDVHVVRIDGSDAYRITDHPADDFAPLWSPDSRHLAFKSNRLGSVALWTVEVKDGRPVGQPTKLRDGMQAASVVDWTERGIFYTQRTDSWDIYTMPMDPNEGRSAGSPRPIRYSRTGRNVSPTWSPDGKHLAFVSSAASEPNRRYLVVMPADGGQAREFLIPTTAWEYSQSPYDVRWFGDGRGLGFSGHDTRGAAVFRLVLDTGQWQAIPMSNEDWRTRIEWNRDGSAFYFMRQTGTAGIYERAVNSDAERMVHRSAPASIVRIRGLQFSPDRKWLAFAERMAQPDGTGSQRIFVTDVATGDTRTVLENTLGLNDALTMNLVSWTPTGELLVERIRDERAWETVILPVTGGAPRPFTMPRVPTAPGESRQDLIANWSFDGRSMVMSRVNRGWETFVIEHPLAGLRARTASR